MAYNAAQKLVSRRQRLARLMVQMNRLDTEKAKLESEIAELMLSEEVTEQALEIEERILRDKLAHIEALKEDKQ